MSTRWIGSVVVAALLVAAGGWFAGASAASTGYTKWLEFRSGSANEALCAQNQASITEGPNSWAVTGTERATERSGSTCGSGQPRPYNYMQATLQLAYNGSSLYDGFNVNANGVNYADVNGYAYKQGSGCYISRVKGAQWDSSQGWRIQPYFNAIQACI